MLNKVEQMMAALTTGSEAGDLQQRLIAWLEDVRTEAGLPPTALFDQMESAVLFVWLGINAVTTWGPGGYGQV